MYCLVWTHTGKVKPSLTDRMLSSCRSVVTSSPIRMVNLVNMFFTATLVHAEIY